jgi:HEAT repeat protein
LANDLTTYRDQIVLAANEASARIRAFSTIIEEIKRLETVAKKGENEDVRSKALATLVSRTSHSDEDVKVSARKAIDRALEYPKKIEEIKGLETGAKGKNEYVRRQALERLKELKDIDPDEDISGAAKDAIDRIQVTRKINDLKVLAKSSDKIIRQQALADLERLANDSDKYCSSEAKKALEEIKSEEDKKVVKVNEVTGTSKSEKTVVPEQTKVEPNTPINISEELAKKLKLDSLLRRENLLGLISSWNYNLILNLDFVQ